MEKIVLVLPNCFNYSRTLDIDCKEPLGILYIASYMRSKGYTVDIIDAATYGLSVVQTADLIEMAEASIIGFSVVQRTVSVTMEIVNVLRKRGLSAHITMGGYLPTLSSDFLTYIDDFEKNIDSVIIGEGEISFYELAEALKCKEDWKKVNGLAWVKDGQVQYSEPREKIKDLDILPFPARDLLPKVLATIGTASMFSSRGCYGNCTFCSQNAFDKRNPGPSWRGRSPQNVVDEIEYLVQNFHVKTIKFNDDNIFGPGKVGKERIIGICKELKRRNLNVKLMAYCRANDVDYDTMLEMKSAGFERILLGVESTNDDILAKYKKGVTFKTIENAIKILRDVGMSTIPGYMMFNPYSTVEDIKNSITFLRSIDAFGVTISKTLIIHDSTEIKESVQSEGRLIETNVLEGYHKYKVDEKLAKVYLVNKIFWASYIDPLNRDSKFIVTALKNRPSFNDRKKWEEVLEKRWHLQAELMEESLDWTETKDEKRISVFISTIVERFISLNDYLIKELPQLEEMQYPEYNIGYFKVRDKELFMDIHTSKIVEVNNDLLKRALFKLMATSNVNKVISIFEDKYGKEDLESVERFIPNNFTVKEYVRPEFPSVENFIAMVMEILNNDSVSTLFENYVW